MSVYQDQPLTPETTNATVVNEAQVKEVQRRQIAAALIEIMTFLRATATSRDFFEGYSLSEAIQERLDLIGGSNNRYTQSPSGSPTLLAELDRLEEAGLQAISDAMEFEEVADIPEYERAYDIELIGAYSDTFIEEGNSA